MWGVWENSLPDKFTEYVWNDLDPYLLPPFEKTEEKKVVVPATSIPVFYGKIEYGDSSSCKGIFGVDLREKECVEYEVEPLRDMSEKGRKKAKKSGIRNILTLLMILIWLRSRKFQMK